MALINEAYAVLSEPGKRSAYDEGLRAPAESFDDVILTAARDMLSTRGWTRLDDQPHAFTLRNGARQVSVALVPALTAAAVSAHIARMNGFGVILTLRVDGAGLKRAGSFVVIDVMRSRVVAGSFPDAVYEELFRPLC
jgi:curved DNA-binding protein CbpA